METNSNPEAAASTVKQGQYSPRKRKDTAPKVNPQLAIELFFQEMGRIEAYTKKEEFAFLKAADSIALQQSLRDLDRGFVNFFQKRASY